MITVMGATGNTGRKIVEGLLAAGERVRGVARDERKLASLREAGAETARGDATDPTFLASTFEGVDAVYTLLPTDRTSVDYRARQDEEGEAIANAIRASGVRHVVALSAVGAELSEGNGVIAGLHAQEQRLRQVEGVNVLFLRPVSLFENFREQLETVRLLGFVADSVEADLAIPMVGSRDVASAAVRALVERDWTGHHVRELIGPRDLSYREATTILGERIGRPDLQYVQLPYEEMIGALVEAGLSESFASTYVEMTRAFNEDTVRPLVGRTPENTTPTTFESYADELARSFVVA